MVASVILWRRPQFGLRAMLLAVSATALVTAWIAWQAHTARERTALLDRISQAGGSVYTSAELSTWPTGPRLSAVRRYFGDQSVGTIYLPPPAFGPGDHARVKAAFPEAYIWPSG